MTYLVCGDYLPATVAQRVVILHVCDSKERHPAERLAGGSALAVILPIHRVFPSLCASIQRTVTTPANYLFQPKKKSRSAGVRAGEPAHHRTGEAERTNNGFRPTIPPKNKSQKLSEQNDF